MRNRSDSIAKLLLIVAIVIIVGIAMSVGVRHISNKQVFDMTNSFERAIICLPNGDVIDGKVTSWLDFEDGDQIQVKIDGKTYLTHITNVTLISN